MTHTHIVKISKLLSDSNKESVTSGYMALARYFTDNVNNTETYKVSMYNYLETINEIVVIDMDKVKSMIIEYMDFKNYWNTDKHTKIRHVTSFSNSVGLSFIFNATYVECVDKHPATYNSIYMALSTEGGILNGDS